MAKPNKLKPVHQGKRAKAINIIKDSVSKQSLKPILHNDMFARCMIAADKITQDTKGAFFTIWAEAEALPMAYIFQGYHGNSMIVEYIREADLIIENYEHDEQPKMKGSKEHVAYVALFKESEGILPWLVK